MAERDPKESVKAIDSFAWRVLRRLHSAGDRSMSLEDVKQECWIAWCVACESYDAESGVPFLAYLNNGMRLHLNRYVEKHVGRRHQEVTALSLDFKVEDGGEEMDFSDIVPSADPSPHDLVERESQVNHALSKLSPTAQMFVNLLERQPPELMAEVRRVDQRAEYARERGIDAVSFRRLTANMVFDVMGIDRFQRHKVYKELKKMGAKFEKAFRK